MATFFLRVMPIKRAQGRSAVACAAYRAGDRLHDDRLGLTFDYRAKARRGEVVHQGILAPADAAPWMADREMLWNTLEAMERRKDARPAREILIALPHEMTDAQRHACLMQFLTAEVVARGMIADYAIHRPMPARGRDAFDPDRDPDPRNVHAHVLISTRAIVHKGGEATFGAKPQAWNDRRLISRWREGWADCVNSNFAAMGVAVRIDHRSHKDRGIDREPEPHVGPAGTHITRKGGDSERQRARDDVKRRNAERGNALVMGAPQHNVLIADAATIARDADARLAAIRSALMTQDEIVTDAALRLNRLTESQLQLKGQFAADAEAIDQLVKDQQRLIGIIEKERGDADKQKRLALEEEEQKRLARQLLSDQPRLDPPNPERSISQVSERFARALQSAHYDPQNHYAGLSKAVWIEAQQLKKEQGRLATQISEERDEVKRQGLILRYEIQHYDYMAAASTRVAGMSVAVRGHNPDADKVRLAADAYAHAATVRRELYTQHFSAQSLSRSQGTETSRQSSSQSRDESSARDATDRSRLKSWGGHYSAARYSAKRQQQTKDEGKDANTEEAARDRTDRSGRDR